MELSIVSLNQLRRLFPAASMDLKKLAHDMYSIVNGQMNVAKYLSDDNIGNGSIQIQIQDKAAYFEPL